MNEPGVPKRKPDFTLAVYIDKASAHREHYVERLYMHRLATDDSEMTKLASILGDTILAVYRDIVVERLRIVQAKAAFERVHGKPL